MLKPFLNKKKKKSGENKCKTMLILWRINWKLIVSIKLIRSHQLSIFRIWIFFDIWNLRLLNIFQIFVKYVNSDYQNLAVSFNYFFAYLNYSWFLNNNIYFLNEKLVTTNYYSNFNYVNSNFENLLWPRESSDRIWTIKR